MAGTVGSLGWGKIARAETSESSLLEAIDLKLDGDPKLARRALVLVPKRRESRRSLLILLHGLGETGSELLGIHAWSERYGLVRAYERLSNPPVSPERPRLGYLTSERAEQINSTLAKHPFTGPVLVCPVTPNPYRNNRTQLLDAYARWLGDVLIPGVRQRLGLDEAPLRVGLDGCSLGGYVGLEVMLRRPELFDSFGVVQAAIGEASAPSYAKQLAAAVARVGPRPLHIETSKLDPYHQPCRRLSEELSALGVPNQFRLVPGPHDQPWLREVGSLEMLLWHDRQLNHAVAKRPGP